MSDTPFWINVSGISGDVTDRAVDITEVRKDTLQTVKVGFRQAIDVKNNIFKKYPSIEEASLRKDNPAFDFLKVPPKMEKRFHPISIFYNKMQRHAVVLQAMMQDTEAGNLSELLNGAKRNMIGILDSLEILMMASNVERMENVFEDVMPNELRSQQAIPMRNVHWIVSYVDLLKSSKYLFETERNI